MSCRSWAPSRACRRTRSPSARPRCPTRSRRADMGAHSVAESRAAVPADDAEPWQAFVLTHGRGSRLRDLAHVLGRSTVDIGRARMLGPASGKLSGAAGYGFAELFVLWHGREPSED